MGDRRTRRLRIRTGLFIHLDARRLLQVFGNESSVVMTYPPLQPFDPLASSNVQMTGTPCWCNPSIKDGGSRWLALVQIDNRFALSIVVGSYCKDAAMLVMVFQWHRVFSVN